MPIFKYGSIPSWILNPVGNIFELINKGNPNYNPSGEPLITRDDIRKFGSNVNRVVSNIWNDITGISAIEKQNELDRQMAEEQYQRTLDSIGDTAAAQEAAGFNRNLMYGNSPVQYQAPDLQAYSGSSRIDTILSRVGKVLNFIPAMYQATAALESIDQARERTKQSEIKTMADGLNLLNLGYSVGEKRFSLPFSPTLYPYRFGDKRHVKQIDYSSLGSMPMNNSIGRYMDAALKNKFDLLESIGISNSLRSTRNSYLGYQYDLDRRFGAAGRIVGMASQGLGAAAKFLPLGSFFKR